MKKNFSVIEEISSSKDGLLVFLFILCGVVLSTVFGAANLHYNFATIFSSTFLYLFYFLALFVWTKRLIRFYKNNSLVKVRTSNILVDKEMKKILLISHSYLTFITVILAISTSVLFYQDMEFIKYPYNFSILFYNLWLVFVFWIFFFLIMSVFYYFNTPNEDKKSTLFVSLFLIFLFSSLISQNLVIENFSQLYYLPLNILGNFTYSSFALEVSYKFVGLFFLVLCFLITAYFLRGAEYELAS